MSSHSLSPRSSTGERPPQPPPLTKSSTPPHLPLMLTGQSFTGSSLSRAGILQPRSYSSTNTSGSSTGSGSGGSNGPVPAGNGVHGRPASSQAENTALTMGSHGAVHTRSTIRLDTVQLSDIILSSSSSSASSSSSGGTTPLAPSGPPPSLPPMSIGMTPTVGPSNLSMMLAQAKQAQLPAVHEHAEGGSPIDAHGAPLRKFAQRRPSLHARGSSGTINTASPTLGPRRAGLDANRSILGAGNSYESVTTITARRAMDDDTPSTPYVMSDSSTSTTRQPSPQKQSSSLPTLALRLSETTPLLPPRRRPSSPTPSWPKKPNALTQKLSAAARSIKYNARDLPRQCIAALPAVLLGSLLNILDGVSYGMIMFPASGVFADKGSLGVSMFFTTAVIAQLVYTFGGSGFAGANGSMMIEVVPFFHILGTSIAQIVGEENEARVMATTIVAFAGSSLLTGMTFFLLGYLKLGAIIGFFPRHILVGCIGGVGVFLIETGIAVCLRIEEDDLDLTMATLKFVFTPANLVLWLLPLGLAILLRLITMKFKGQLVFPIYFLTIPIIFYIIVLSAKLNLGHLRQTGWIFDIEDTGSGKWYEFYSWLDLRNIDARALWETMPTQLALLFFNILHPPLNVPALSVSLNEDVDTNKELVGHGYSNFLAGVFGVVPNYLVYVNTLLFYRVGGGTRVAGFLLAVATFGLLLMGTAPIAFLPVMVVGALIFVLGIDLVKEALWDTRKRVSWMEYSTICSIVVAMTAWDFVTGVLFGIIVSCFFFVVQNSQARSIRALHTGETAMSTVRRPSAQRAYIREASKQTMILRLQGFLFFGTITHVESTIRSLIDSGSESSTSGTTSSSIPSSGSLIRFLVLDLTLVAGVDISAAESFVRVHRLLRSKGIVLVFCGFEEWGAVGKALRSVGLIAHSSNGNSDDGHGEHSGHGGEGGAEGVEAFEGFGDAIEWIENAYLKTWWRSRGIGARHVTGTGVKEIVGGGLNVGRRTGDVGESENEQGDGVGQMGSPRLSHLRDVANRTIACDLEGGVVGLEANSRSTPSSTTALAEASSVDSEEMTIAEFQMTQEPFRTLLKAFSSYNSKPRTISPPAPSPDLDAQTDSGSDEAESTTPIEQHLLSLIPYFKRIITYEGQVLFRQGDTSDGLYVVESGVLRAIYEFGGCYWQQEDLEAVERPGGGGQVGVRRDEGLRGHRSRSDPRSGGGDDEDDDGGSRSRRPRRRRQPSCPHPPSSTHDRHTPYPYQITEAMVAGTLAGELSFLADHERNATVIVEREGVLWMLEKEELRRAERERPKDAARFVREVVKAAKIDYDILLSALATRQ